MDCEPAGPGEGGPGGGLTVQGRQGSVTFRPYRDIRTKVVQQAGEEELPTSPTTVETLYPELLCHIFSFLSTESKGRAAQVLYSLLLLSALSSLSHPLIKWMNFGSAIHLNLYPIC